ncbi:MAG: hypothetical protein CMH34_11675 [Microbacterium sp.]|nr:hypothetical protein [Microbacterium sp.]
MTTIRDEHPVRPVSFSRLERRGILLGLSGPRLAAATFAIVVLVASLSVAGTTGMAWTSPLWGAALTVALARAGGRALIEWAPVVAHWLLRKARSQTRYRRRIVKPKLVGSLALPGDAARLRHYDDPESGAVMVHDPHAGTLLALVEVTHPAFVLLDPAEQQRRVEGWGRALSTLCRSTRVARVQVLERTIPDAGTGLESWWREHGVDDGSWAARVYSELIDRAAPTAERHVTTITLSVDLRAASRAIRSAGGGMKGAAAVLRQDMEALTSALRSAELRPGRWVTPDDLALMLRSAYDPAVAAALERHSAVGRELATAGPIAVEERWASLRSDSAHHAVLWLSEWPRSMVYPGFLSPILLASGVRRAVSIVYDPIRPDVAARAIRRRKVEHLSDRAQRARIGQVEDAAISAELDDVLQQEADLVAGHGILRYAAFIAVTATTADELEAAVARIEQAAIQASCETRRIWGQQAQAFVAAALPLARGL